MRVVHLQASLSTHTEERIEDHLGEEEEEIEGLTFSASDQLKQQQQQQCERTSIGQLAHSLSLV